MPPMSAEPERVFSGSRRTVDWSRCRLSPATIEKLECIKHWVKQGLDIPIDGEEEEELSEVQSETQEHDFDELTFENLERHAALLAEVEELEPIDQDETQALELIPRQGQDDDSDIFHDEPCDSETEEFEA